MCACCEDALTLCGFRARRANYRGDYSILKLSCQTSFDLPVLSVKHLLQHPLVCSTTAATAVSECGLTTRTEFRALVLMPSMVLAQRSRLPGAT